MTSLALKQSTAVTITVGPFLDATDGNTQENGLTIPNTEIKLFKENASGFVNKSAGNAVSIGDGYYTIALDASDTDTVGNLEIVIHQSANALATKKVCTIYPAKIYDSAIAGTDNLEVDVIQVAGASGSANLPSSQASLDALNDFDPASEQVIVATNNDKTGYTVSGGVDVTALNGSSQAAANLAISAGTMVIGTVGASSLSSTTCSTNLTEATDDHYINRAIIFVTGNLANQASLISDYAGSSKVLTFTEVTEAPAIGDTFIIV